MNEEAKQYMVQSLRKEFIAFMQGVAKIPGSHVQKQQAFLRFDEGHMWMQNSILSHVAPQQEAEPQSDKPIVPDTEVVDEAIVLTPEDVEKQIIGTENQLMQPEGQPLVSPAE